MNAEGEQLTLFDLDSSCGKTFPERSAAERRSTRTSALSWRRSFELKAVPYMFLDLNGPGNLLGLLYWETHSPWHGGSSILNTGPAPLNAEDVYSLSRILQDTPPRKYYLSRTACLGILRRAKERGKELPFQLKWALMAQAGLASAPTVKQGLKAYHFKQREKVNYRETAKEAALGHDEIDLHGVMVTNDMQMQPFITGGTTAFAANQRDEVRDLHDVAGTLGSQPGMKQQTFIAEGALDPWNTQQARIFSPDGGDGRSPAGLLFAAGVVAKGNGECFLTPERHTTLSGGGGMPGQGYPCVFTAGFSAGAGAKAGSIGYSEEIAPTLKGTVSGNCMPSVLCLNDQGGSVMGCSEDISGTLRAQEHGHQPLVYENHGIDARYTGPHPVSPTLSARGGTGGNNLPLVADDFCICITGNAIDRQPQNGGNGIGIQSDISYTLTATDHHAVFSRQRVDVFKDDDVASTESARQHKDATDLVYQPEIGPLLIRRLTPLECERLQGFPDGWTDLPGASDSARYKALGNSVAIPCVEFIMRGIAMVLECTA